MGAGVRAKGVKGGSSAMPDVGICCLSNASVAADPQKTLHFLELSVCNKTKPKSQAPAVNSKEEKVVDKEEEDYGGQVTGGSSCAASQDLFLTPLQSSQSSTGEPDAGERKLRVSHFTPMEGLSQIRRRKKWTQDDMFNEILQVRAVSDCEHRAWKRNIAGWRAQQHR
ncbi:uncharacterized protein LOC141989158 isoform X3 [Natator depressus]|uniref:uncharacterized protein LOC141989158 isoform X3 n=1 Tax=Natator depressus TaxID=27790 RepID=UPI003EBB0D0A